MKRQGASITDFFKKTPKKSKASDDAGPSSSSSSAEKSDEIVLRNTEYQGDNTIDSDD